jgi:S1-C subfamily serine protease
VPNLPNRHNVPNVPNVPNQPGRAAYLGVEIANAPSADGADVTAVMGGSPAAAAGLQVGDRITSVDGAAVASSTQLIAAISGRSPGDTVVVGYVRNGVAATARVQLGARADAAPTSPTTSRPALQLIS